MKASAPVVQIITLALTCHAVAAWREFNDLRVKTDAFGLTKTEAYYQIPTISSSPLFKNYVKVDPEPGFKFQMNFYCLPNDPRVCFMFDKKGNVAGVQLSILKEDVSQIKPEHYDYNSHPNYVKTNFFNIPAYSVRVYFTNPEKLTAEGRQNTEETAEGLWMYLDGKLVEIQRKEPTEPKMGDFDRQGCYPAMGQHYIYKYNKDTPCKHFFPVFPLYEKGGLVGIGMAALSTGSKGPLRDWYEKPTQDVMKIIIPNPVCSELSKNYAITSVHIFLVDNPWDIACP